jgi:hypothetical protein
MVSELVWELVELSDLIRISGEYRQVDEIIFPVHGFNFKYLL